MTKKKIMMVFGTRPEAIKMCPLAKVIQADGNFDLCLCVTSQHEEMLEQVLKVFKVVPDYNLHIMKANQTLFDITVSILGKIKEVLEKERPDLVLVHGDTTTSFVVSLACFYLKIKVGHVEAGLRTNNLFSPYPEEFNRQVVDILSDIYFAPTEKAKQNLVNEGKKVDKIFVTGNTAIDALKYTVTNSYQSDLIDWSKDSKLILLTAHRRENIGKPMESIFAAINELLARNQNLKVIYPLHKNPVIQKLAREHFSGQSRIKLVEPLDAYNFHNLINKCHMILTDSGGIQEEAPFLHKPVLVLRDTTERPEGIEAGTLKLIGTDSKKIVDSVEELLFNSSLYDKMANSVNPYGDGFACERIVKILKEKLQ